MTRESNPKSNGGLPDPTQAVSKREASTAEGQQQEALGPASGSARSETNDHQEAAHPPLSPPNRMAQPLPETTTPRDEQRHEPPLSVIVVSTHSGPSSGATAPVRRESRSSSSMFSAPFRLQPRNAMTASTTGRDGAIRGRKRSANSMSASAMARDSLLTTKPTANTCTPERMSSQNPRLALPFPGQEVPLPQATRKSAAMTTPKRQGHTPPRVKRGLGGRLDHAVVNFQCLSLQSPKRNDSSVSPLKSFSSPTPNFTTGHTPCTSGPPPSSSSSSCGTAPQRPAMVPGSISGSMQPRSSFTPVYNAASPCGSLRSYGSGSIGSNNRLNANARSVVYSPNAGGSSTKSSPKIAPLTVLTDRGSKLPVREGNPRPPLHGGGMNSLWLSLESSTGSSHSGDDEAPQDEAGMYPPRTVLCRGTSFDSISTVQNSVLSPLPRPSPMMSPRAFSSPASAAPPPGIPKSCTPSSKQRRRVDEFTSPSQRTPRTPQTPLPRVTLTPRSNASRGGHQSGQGLPRFPSPSDADIMDVTSSFLSSAAAASLRDASLSRFDGAANNVDTESNDRLGAIRSFFPASSNSLALSADGSTNEGGREASTLASGSATTVTAANKKHPLPVLDLSMKKLDTSSSPDKELSFGIEDLSGGFFMGIQTKSLLTPSRSGGILQAMMEEDAGMNGDLGSVSDIDEDEGFVLASPSAIEQERLARCQPARQRRRRSCDRFSPDSPNASNSNLAGMNYVTSNTSLFGMDIAHPTDVAGGEQRLLTDRRTTGESPSSPRQLFGSMVEKCPSKSQASTQENHLMKRRKSDASFASIGLALEGSGGDGGRDLVTPPAMPNPQTPPPLSPKDGDFVPVVVPQGTVYQHTATQTSTVCVAGADRRSVTMAIARMAFEAQHHSDSSPVS